MTKTKQQIRDEAANEHVFETISDLALYRMAGNSFKMGFKAGFDRCDKLENEALKIALEALELLSSHNPTWCDDFLRAQSALAEIKKIVGEG